MPDEVIVADDGSGAGHRAARCLVGTLDWACPCNTCGRRIKGFRAGRSRNRGIAAARGEYSSCSMATWCSHEQFVADHARARRAGLASCRAPRISTDAHCAGRMLDATSVRPSVRFTRGLRRPHLAVRSRWLSPHLSRRHADHVAREELQPGALARGPDRRERLQRADASAGVPRTRNAPRGSCTPACGAGNCGSRRSPPICTIPCACSHGVEPERCALRRYARKPPHALRARARSASAGVRRGHSGERAPALARLIAPLRNSARQPDAVLAREPGIER